MKRLAHNRLAREQLALELNPARSDSKACVLSLVYLARSP